jgi:hypothetical protein
MHHRPRSALGHGKPVGLFPRGCEEDGCNLYGKGPGVMQGVFPFLYFLGMSALPITLFMFMYIAPLVPSPPILKFPCHFHLGFTGVRTPSNCSLPTFTALFPRSSDSSSPESSSSIFSNKNTKTGIIVVIVAALVVGLALWIQRRRYGRVRKPYLLDIPDHVANPSPQPDYATGGECKTDGDYQTSERGHESGEPLSAGRRLSRPPPMQVQEQDNAGSGTRTRLLLCFVPSALPPSYPSSPFLTFRLQPQ